MLCCAVFPALVRAQEPPNENALIEVLRAEATRYEHGDGVERDGARAAALYCKAARLGDAESQFRLGWMYANARGVERSETRAAFFFHAAAERGSNRRSACCTWWVGRPPRCPECMRESAAPRRRPWWRRRRAQPRRSSRQRRPRDRSSDWCTCWRREFRVQPRLALAIIEAESNFNVVARSPKNAQGLMQLVPATAARFDVGNPYDAAQNIRGGLAYLRWLLAYFEGDVLLVAAAYNAGEATVERYRGVPPYLETRAYVRRILRAVGSASHPFDGAVTPPSRSCRRSGSRVEADEGLPGDPARHKPLLPLPPATMTLVGRAPWPWSDPRP